MHDDIQEDTLEEFDDHFDDGFDDFDDDFGSEKNAPLKNKKGLMIVAAAVVGLLVLGGFVLLSVFSSAKTPVLVSDAALDTVPITTQVTTQAQGQVVAQEIAQQEPLDIKNTLQDIDPFDTLVNGIAEDSVLTDETPEIDRFSVYEAGNAQDLIGDDEFGIAAESDFADSAQDPFSATENVVNEIETLEPLSPKTEVDDFVQEIPIDILTSETDILPPINFPEEKSDENIANLTDLAVATIDAQEQHPIDAAPIAQIAEREEETVSAFQNFVRDPKANETLKEDKPQEKLSEDKPASIETSSSAATPPLLTEMVKGVASEEEKIIAELQENKSVREFQAQLDALKAENDVLKRQLLDAKASDKIVSKSKSTPRKQARKRLRAPPKPIVKPATLATGLPEAFSDIPVKTEPLSIVETVIPSWRLRAANEQGAYISNQTGGDLLNVQVGQRIDSLGLIRLISFDPARGWIVVTDSGLIVP